jgi:hypothetical protein
VRRALIIVSAAAAVTAGTASGAGTQASCVGLVTSFEATTLEAGSVGHEVSGLAQAGSLGAFVRELAAAHPGSLPACAG